MKLSCRTPPTDKREATKWRNRQAIVEAAAQLTAEHGIDGFSVESLAERAGVSRRTIFNHFSSVDEAIFASFATRVDQLYEEVEKALGASRSRRCRRRASPSPPPCARSTSSRPCIRPSSCSRPWTRSGSVRMPKGCAARRSG